MKANKPCSGHLVDRGGYYHTVIYVLENGKRKPISRTTGLPVKNNLRKAQKILEDRKREKISEKRPIFAGLRTG